MLHRNIAPESILINQHGAWKIAGFEYCLGKGFLCGYRSINHHMVYDMDTSLQ
jgi:hypothetical protein